MICFYRIFKYRSIACSPLTIKEVVLEPGCPVTDWVTFAYEMVASNELDFRLKFTSSE
jgi:hypothetical protein